MLGVDEETRQQVIAWHGTISQKDVLKDFKYRNQESYGKLMSGVYFGDIVTASFFAGTVPGLSRMLKVELQEEDFYTIDMQQGTPGTTEQLSSILSKDQIEDLTRRKESGEIKGLKLINSLENGRVSDQFLVFDEKAIKNVEELTEEQVEDVVIENAMVLTTKLQKSGISLVPQGFVHNNTVYLNEEAVDPVNTLIHEHGHLFNSWAKENKPEIYQRGLELIQEQGQEYIDYVKRVQPNLEGEALLEEALTQAIGDKGARVVDANRKSSITQWLNDLWQSIKETLGITQYTAEQLQDLNLQQFAEAVTTDMLSEESFIGEQGKINFERWKGDNREVSGQEVQDVKTGEPIVARVYHGTTNDFYVFDSSVKGNVEGYLGKVNYFTTDEVDAEQNYLEEGPDLKIRIDRRAESISSYIVDEGLTDIDGNLDKAMISQDFNLSLEEVQDIEDIDEMSEFIANKELKGGQSRVLDLFVKLNNPVVIGRGTSWIDLFDQSQIEDYLDDAVTEIAEEYDITEQEAKEEYSWDITQKAMELSGYESPLIEALQEAIDQSTEVSQKSAQEVLGDFVYEQEIDLNQLEKIIREELSYEQNEEGDLVSSQVVAQTFKNLGFDGIILNNPSQKFRNMDGLFDTTSHIHVFDEFNNQIKLADGSNYTFGETSDIRYQQQEIQQPSQPTIITDPQLSKDYQSIFNSNIKILDLYPENEQEIIDEKVEDCR